MQIPSLLPPAGLLRHDLCRRAKFRQQYLDTSSSQAQKAIDTSTKGDKSLRLLVATAMSAGKELLKNSKSEFEPGLEISSGHLSIRLSSPRKEGIILSREIRAIEAARRKIPKICERSNIDTIISANRYYWMYRRFRERLSI